MRDLTSAVLAIAFCLGACQDEASSNPERMTHMGDVTAAPPTGEPSTPEVLNWPALPGVPTASASAPLPTTAADAGAAGSAAAAGASKAAPGAPLGGKLRPAAPAAPAGKP